MSHELPSHPADPAKHQTDLATYRTKLALDRTSLAWVRTALTMASFGFGMVAFFRTLQEQSPGPISSRLHHGAIQMGAAAAHPWNRRDSTRGGVALVDAS